MKKVHAAFLVVTAASLILGACGDSNPANNTNNTNITIETEATSTEVIVTDPIAVTTETVTETVIDDTIPPKEGMVRSKLTNEWIDPNIYDQRPIAVMIPNESSAIPHYGLSEASILYEANVEGRMTRMMAIFEDYESIEKLGNIRSLRDYYPYWAFEWDAIICNFGGPY